LRGGGGQRVGMAIVQVQGLHVAAVFGVAQIGRAHV
jgi:hypothetical protein